MTAGTIDFWHPTRRCALHRGKGLAVRTGLLAATGELYLARQLGLQVAEVGVRAEERDGSKVRIAIDALAMLGEALAVRRAAAIGAYDRPERTERGELPTIGRIP